MISEANKLTVRLPVVIEEGAFKLLDGSPLPALRDKVVGDLVFDTDDLTNEQERQAPHLRSTFSATLRPGTRKSDSTSRTKPNHPRLHPLLPLMLLLRPPHLPDLPLHHLLRHPPLRRVRIRAPRMNSIHADVEDVPAAQAA